MVSHIKERIETGGVREKGAEEDIGGWRKLHNVMLDDLYSTAYIIRMIIQRRMRRTENVECTGKTEMHIKFWWRKVKQTDHIEVQVTEGRITLQLILNK